MKLARRRGSIIEYLYLLKLTDEHGVIDVVIWHDLCTQSYAVLASSEGLRVTGVVQANYGVSRSLQAALREPISAKTIRFQAI